MVNLPSLSTTAAVFNVLDNITKNPVSNYALQSVGDRLTTSKLFKDISIEASSAGNKLIQSNVMPQDLGLNGFAEAIHLAFSEHHGLALYPDHIFISILQGLSIHISQDPEKHRATLGLGHTAPGTKETIDIRRDGFVKGSSNNDWQSLFPEFSEKIGKKVSNDVHVLLTSPYSTSTPLSTAVTSLTIMDVFKSYFEYSLTSLCGIPDIALMGTQSDWDNLLSRTQSLLGKFDDLDFWTNSLYPVLRNFASAASNKSAIDKGFWSRIYKPKGGSGGPYITGWINAFLPYLQSNDSFRKNRHIDWTVSPRSFSGINYDDIPAGFTKTPFTWNYFDQELPMEFVGGFLGVEKVETRTLNNFVSPSLGWAVVYKNTNPSSQKKNLLDYDEDFI